MGTSGDAKQLPLCARGAPIGSWGGGGLLPPERVEHVVNLHGPEHLKLSAVAATYRLAHQTRKAPTCMGSGLRGSFFSSSLPRVSTKAFLPPLHYVNSIHAPNAPR